MNWLIAQVESPEPGFWGLPHTDAPLLTQGFFWAIVGSLVGMVVVIFFLARVPSNFRRPIAVAFVFLAGMFYVLEWVLPRGKDMSGETVIPFLFGSNYEDAVPVVANLSQIIFGLLLALGILSIFRVHFGRLFRLEKDWFFSFVLLGSMAVMIVFGLMNWSLDQAVAREAITSEQASRTIAAQGFQFVFFDMLQNLDAAMFSLIAFFILSAAYRAFRIKSIEATIMMATALVVLMSFIPIFLAITNWLPADQFVGNFRVDTIGDWILDTINAPALRAIDLGLGLGILAMAIRIMLGLERGVSVD
ncbi:MAG: hypothetical protein IH851_08105 [Armatimonadetes bacterium]|nr:hypothetical protein [Armatimonadota bacterium]